MTFDKIEKTLAGMTPGPWKWEPDVGCDPGMVQGNDSLAVVFDAVEGLHIKDADAQGIAMLRNLAPMMLEVVKAADLVKTCGAGLGFQVLRVNIAALKAAVEEKP